MNKEHIIAHMQKPARILRVICSILFVLAIIGTILSTLAELSLPILAKSLLSVLDNPQVEQTEDIREAIALLEEYVSMPIHVTVTMAFYVLASGVTSVLMFLFLKRLFASLAEERYSILRTEYANGIQSVAIMMLVLSGIELVFPLVIELMTLDTSTTTEISSSSNMLLPGLLLLAIASIYRHACRLQLLTEQEAFENFKASESANGDAQQTEDAESYRAEEEAQSKQEDKPPFEGF